MVDVTRHSRRRANKIPSSACIFIAKINESFIYFGDIFSWLVGGHVERKGEEGASGNVGRPVEAEQKPRWL